jgi:arylsulfatase
MHLLRSFFTNAQLWAAVLSASALLPTAAVAGSDARPDVVLISLDTLRPDHLSIYGYPRETDPALARLAGEAVVFEQAYSQSSKTAPSHMTLMTGLLPEVHGVANVDLRRERVRVSEDVPTLAEILHEAGYHTVGVHGGGNVSADYGFDRGFDAYVEERELGPWLRAARERVARHDAEDRRPLFLFLHTYQIHAPYLPPPEHARRFVDPAYSGRIASSVEALTAAAGHRPKRWSHTFWDLVDESSEADVRHLVDLYDAGIHFTDEGLGGFLDGLRARPRWSHTLLIVLSDHGEAFGDHGRFQHKTLHQEILQVPLLIRFPAGDPLHGARRVPDVVRLMDVPVTVLDRLAIAPPGFVQGRSLLPLLRGEPGGEPVVVSQQAPGGGAALRLGDWKLIRERRRDALYHVSVDPAERVDRAGDQALRLEVLRERLDRLLAGSRALREGLAAPDRAPLDPASVRRLEALGYLDSQED